MKQKFHSPRAVTLSRSRVWHAFPWSKITLMFFMISSFLLFATTGANSAETGILWTAQVSEILAGTAIFSLATMMLIFAGRLLPKNL